MSIIQHNFAHHHHNQHHHRHQHHHGVIVIISIMVAECAHLRPMACGFRYFQIVIIINKIIVIIIIMASLTSSSSLWLGRSQTYGTRCQYFHQVTALSALAIPIHNIIYIYIHHNIIPQYHKNLLSANTS